MARSPQPVVAQVSPLSFVLKRFHARARSSRDRSGFIVARPCDGGPVYISRISSNPESLLIGAQISHAAKMSADFFCAPRRSYDAMLLALKAYEVEGHPGWYDGSICGAGGISPDSQVQIVRGKRFKNPANPFRQGTWRHAAHEVLSVANMPLRNQEVSRYALDMGLMITRAARPHASMSRALMDGKRMGHFEYVERLRKWQLPGQFDQRRIVQARPPEQAPVPAQPGLDPETCAGSGVYLIEDPVRGALKIGHAVNLAARFATLQAASGYDLRIVGWIETSVPIMLERELHRVFGHSSGGKKSAWLRGEWFEAQRVMGTLAPLMVDADDTLMFLIKLRQHTQAGRGLDGTIMLADDVGRQAS